MAYWQSPVIYTEPFICEYAKVLGEARGIGIDAADKDKAWSVNLLGSAEDKQISALREQIMSFMKEAHGEGVGFGKSSKPKISANGMPLKAETIKNEETGEPELTGRMKFVIKRKLVQKGGVYNDGPLVIDSQQNPWPQNVLIGNNSMVRAKLHFYAWEYEGVGLTAELHALQVVEHVPYGANEQVSAEGFGNIEGGAIAPKEEEEPPAADECSLDFGKKLAAAASEVEAMDPDQPF